MKTILAPAAAVAALVLLTGVSTHTTPVQASDGIAGEFFAIGGCFQSKSAARKRARRLGGVQVVRTDDYPNFNPGWWCAVEGPFIKSEANYWRGEFRRRGVGDAYVKSGW